MTENHSSKKTCNRRSENNSLVFRVKLCKDKRPNDIRLLSPIHLRRSNRKYHLEVWYSTSDSSGISAAAWQQRLLERANGGWEKLGEIAVTAAEMRRIDAGESIMGQIHALSMSKKKQRRLKRCSIEIKFAERQEAPREIVRDEREISREAMLRYASTPIRVKAQPDGPGLQTRRYVTASERVIEILNRTRKRPLVFPKEAVPPQQGFLGMQYEELKGMVRVIKRTEPAPIADEQEVGEEECDRECSDSSTDEEENAAHHGSASNRALPFKDKLSKRASAMPQDPINLEDLHAILTQLKEGKQLEDIWVELYQCLRIQPRKCDQYQRKVAQNNINYKLKNLLIAHPHLRYYGGERYFTISILSHVPDVLIKDRDEELLKEIQKVFITQRR